MKRFLLLFAVLIMCCTMIANAKGTKIGNLYYILNETNKSATVTWGGEVPVSGTPEYTGSMTIPSTVTYENNDFSVTGIGIFAFQSCKDLTSVTIPNSVTSIGESAFLGCESLTSITIPNSVTIIGEYAFSACKNLTSVVIPNSVASIEARTFSNCSNLASVTIPNSVTSIKEYAFGRCDSLTSVIIPSSLTSIGASVFYYCESLAFVLWNGNVPEELPLEIPQENTDIFEGCSGLQKLVVCDNFADAYKSRFSNHSDKVETLSTFRNDALNEITSTMDTILYELTEQDKTLLQGYIFAVGSATTPGVAFTNKKYALGIINLRPMKNNIIVELFWNVHEHVEKLTTKDMEAIEGYVAAIDVATDEKDIVSFRQSALNVVYLRLAKIDGIAELNILDAKYRGIDFKPYEDAVTNATSVDEVNNIMDTVRSIIQNGKFATIGSIKYMLNNDSGEYMYKGAITVNDKEFFQSDYDFIATGGITYNRTFENTNWQALYVPFVMSYGEWMNGFDIAAINNFHEYTDHEGKTVKTELEVRLVKDHTLKPNHPYLIRAKNGTLSPQTILPINKEMYSSKHNSIVCSSVERKYTFTGTYKEITGLKTMDCIFLSNGRLCKAENDNVPLSAQRWYLTIESLGSQFDDNTEVDAQALSFDIKLLDDEVTGIDEITITRTPLKNNSDAIYNLNGIRVNNGYKGIVIMRGKKYVVK